jgi:hypothetical protein
MSSPDDEALYRRFLEATLTADELSHRAHVRLGFLCVGRHADLAEAAFVFRAALRRLVTALGAAAKYNETLTWAYLVLIHARASGREFASSAAFLEAHPELLDQKAGALSRSYDLEAVTACPEAKASFLLPGDPRLATPPRRAR